MAGSDVLDSSADVRGSARGWHQLQVAVLGFIGLCGVLQRGRPENPMWLQTLAALLIVGALAIALAAIFVVGRVAWPPGLHHRTRHDVCGQASASPSWQSPSWPLAPCRCGGRRSATAACK